MTLANDLDAILPQTQCGECGYPGCMPYAQALAAGLATIDKCPPGGVAVVSALGERLHLDATPYLLDAQINTRAPSLAMIREAECIGCTKCIQACPVDAIIGSAKLMHSVLAHECTGCGLCVEPCPVDCIEMVGLPEALYDANVARERFNAREIRQLKQNQEKEQLYREKRQLVASSTSQTQDKLAKQAYILEALTRARLPKKS